MLGKKRYRETRSVAWCGNQNSRDFSEEGDPPRLHEIWVLESEEAAKIKTARRLSLPGWSQLFSGTAPPSDLLPQNQQGLVL